MGILPPKLNFEPVRADAKKVLTGAPFDNGPDNTILADFKEKVGKLTKDQVREIATTKLPDLNANDIDAAMKIVEGTARSMGITTD